MIITKITVPCGSNHSTLNEGDLIIIYCIQKNVQVDWIYVIRDHMMKAKRRTSGVHSDYESSFLSQSAQMGFTKVGNFYTA